MNPPGTKYVQDSTGQVAHLAYDSDRKKWVIELFVGGPQPRQQVSEWNSCEEAEAALIEDGFVREEAS